ncbi:MAG TPA: fused MFS/spermidine synthase [Pirellulales bacterium]|nr:fused MFS/spermidine synthase [Pirellulales bacterium]
MPLLFAVTLFSAAALLFLVEPMIGKMLLPYFGGAGAVWNTCLAFFQAALLAGYGYAHALTRWRRPRAQLVVHLALLALPWLVLPLVVQADWAPRGGTDPILPLLGMLCATVALPFFVVASTAPLLQQWFAATRHRQAADPYYLYAASNAGSMLGLIAYPFFVEPRFTLGDQSRLWTVGYAVLSALVVACIVMAWRAGVGQARKTEDNVSRASAVPVAAPPTLVTRLHWIALAAVPSSLLLGVTSHLSSDVSPVPLMWVVPLALYLLSFMLAFARLPTMVPRLFAVALPICVMGQIYQAFTWHAGAQYSMLAMASVHLATFFCAAMVCHAELARLRPAPVFLTEYYLWLSFGGVVGGLFNALLAPLLFNSLAEYPLAIAAACMLSPLVLWRWPTGRNWLDLAAAPLIGLISAVILFKTWKEESAWPIVACLALCASTLGRPLSFGLSVAALSAVVGYYDDVVDRVEFRSRDFYGVLQVRGDTKNEFYYLHHGRIRHGQQRREGDAAIRGLPLAYYYPTSPIGQVFAAPVSVLESKPPVAVVGLGVGSLAYYGQGGQEFTFYEIDPAVERLARDDRYFTYLRDSQADCRVVLGDARLSLADAPDRHYGLIVVDAFSGDAIPVHLLTVEAMQVYLQKLAPHGVLAFHISNQFLELGPVLANLAAASSLAGWEQLENTVPAEEKAAGKASSQWVILARDEDDFGPLIEDSRWQILSPSPELPLWTDHYTSLWGIAHWRGS